MGHYQHPDVTAHNKKILESLGSMIWCVEQLAIFDSWASYKNNLGVFGHLFLLHIVSGAHIYMYVAGTILILNSVSVLTLKKTSIALYYYDSWHKL